MSHPKTSLLRPSSGWDFIRVVSFRQIRHTVGRVLVPDSGLVMWESTRLSAARRQQKINRCSYRHNGNPNHQQPIIIISKHCSHGLHCASSLLIALRMGPLYALPLLEYQSRNVRHRFAKPLWRGRVMVNLPWRKPFFEISLREGLRKVSKDMAFGGGFGCEELW